MINDLKESLEEIINRNLFSTAEEISEIIQDKYNINKEDISFTTNNLLREFNIKFKLEDKPISILVIPEEIIIDE